jgi:hypothetical protein
MRNPIGGAGSGKNASQGLIRIQARTIARSNKKVNIFADWTYETWIGRMKSAHNAQFIAERCAGFIDVIQKTAARWVRPWDRQKLEDTKCNRRMTVRIDLYRFDRHRVAHSCSAISLHPLLDSNQVSTSEAIHLYSC